MGVSALVNKDKGVRLNKSKYTFICVFICSFVSLPLGNKAKT